MAKNAFVTGSSKGIGKAIALKLAEAGYNVAVNYNTDEAGGRDTCAQIQAMGRQSVLIPGNIANLEDIPRMFDTFFSVFPTIDVLVNNAGITRFKPFLEVTPELFEQLNAVDWRGSFFCTQTAARHMVEHHTQGVIINITSNHQTGHWPYASVYGPVKAALNKFTEHAAMELAKNGIRVLSVAPGYTLAHDKTKEAQMAERAKSLTPEQREEFARRREDFNRRLPLSRFGEAEEIGDIVAFLCSPGAAYMTGTCIVSDGGALLPHTIETKLEPAVWPIDKEDT